MSHIYIIIFTILVTFFIVPNFIGTNIMVYYIYFLFIVLLLKIRNSPDGIILILLALALCTPSGLAASDIQISQISSLQLIQSRFCRWILMGLGIYLSFDHKNNIYNKHNSLLLISLILCSVIGFVKTGNVNEIYYIMGIIGSIWGIFYTSHRSKMSIDRYFLVIDILFYITTIFAIMEFAFGISPYQKFYSYLANTNVEYLGRAKGLLGHPLYLSGFVLLYQATIFIRMLYGKKLNIVNQVFCVTCALITVSRTTIVVLFLEIIIYCILSEIYKSSKKMFLFLLALSLIIVITFSTGGIYVENLIYRFEEGNVDQRTGAWGTTANLLSENILGVGHSDIMHSIRLGHYSTEKFSAYFTTLDNIYLTEICAYGIAGIFTLIFYYQFLYFSYKKRKKSPTMFKSVLFLHIVISLIGFSFNWNGSFMMCLMFYGTIGMLMRENLIKNKTISYS